LTNWTDIVVVTGKGIWGSKLFTSFKPTHGQTSFPSYLMSQEEQSCYIYISLCSRAIT